MGQLSKAQIEEQDQEHIKNREILFNQLHPEQNQAHAAMLLLSDVQGILHTHASSPLCLHISYDLRYISLEMIENALTEVGFHLDNSLLIKLKRALFYFTEETHRINIGITGTFSTRDIFVNRYEHLKHGCRDERPAHWRKYL